jgi:hypothetical protein
MGSVSYVKTAIHNKCKELLPSHWMMTHHH